MHEAAIAENIATAIQARVASGEIQGRVRTICLQVGRLSAVIPDNLRFMFEVVTRDSELAGVQLEIEVTPVQGHCRACGADFVIDEVDFWCSACRSPQVELRSGHELSIVAVEVD